jgi:RNA polymerase sigma factor (sigma-70 family)
VAAVVLRPDDNLRYLLVFALSHLRRVYRDATPEDAEDVVQELFEKRFRPIVEHHNPAKAPFHPWFLLCLRRFCHARGGQLLEGRMRGAVPAWPPQDDGPSGLSETDVDDLKTCIRRLSDSDRAMLSLCYTEGLSAVEIAAQLGKKAGAIRIGLLRARRRLIRKVLDHHGIDNSSVVFDIALEDDPEPTQKDRRAIETTLEQLTPEFGEALRRRYLEKLSLSELLQSFGSNGEPGQQLAWWRRRLGLARRALLRHLVEAAEVPRSGLLEVLFGEKE